MKLIAGLALFLVLTGCQRPPDKQSAEYFVFGTRVTVSVRDADEAAANNAFGRLGADFRRMHERWHPWEPGALTDLNRALAAGGWTRIEPDLAELLDASRRMEIRSDGHFNAAIGALVALWGFHTSDYPITEPPPSNDDIASLLERRPSMRDIEIDGDRIRSRNNAVQLDFSGIAKGLAVSHACKRLVASGMTDALVNAGGDVMICGPAAKPWRIGVRDPETPQATLDTLEIDKPLAVFTSGNYQRFGEWAGERYAHILDPATGYPVDDIMQATVIDPDAILADAAATALVVAGAGKWRDVAEAMGVKRAAVVLEDGKIETMNAE